MIQAFSRTNRIEKSTKPYGNIVCYRNLKKRTDEAICLFSKTNNVDTVLMESYEYYLEKFKEQLEVLFNIANTPEDVGLLEAEEDKKEFIIAFRDLSKILIKLQTFNDFEFTDETTGLSEQTYQDYKSKYFLIYEETKKTEGEKVSILEDIDLSDEEKREKDIQNIKQQLDRADNEAMSDEIKAPLLKKRKILKVMKDFIKAHVRRFE